MIDESKAAVLLASLASGVIGYAFLRFGTGKTKPPEGGFVES
jgi:Na+/H+ antiporter NhaA